MKKLLLVLPTLLLLAAPVSALANGDHNDNHGSRVSVIAKDNQGNHGGEVSEVAKDNHGTSSVSNQGHKENDQDEGDDKNEEKLEGKEHRSVATAAIRENSSQQLKIKISIKGNNHLGATVSATHSATPSASIKISGPLDQVIQVLSKVLDFLRSLV